MSRFDDLPADQKAVLQLLLRQGKGYDDLAELLRMEPAAVRSRAYDALDALGPGAGGVHTERRRTLSDWLLGQQDPEDAAATRDYLEGSAAGRAWAGAVAGQLAPVAGDRIPEIPGEEPAAAAEPVAAVAADQPDAEPEDAEDEAPAAFVPAPGSEPRVSRRGGAILIGAVLAAIAAVVVVVVLIGGGGSDNDSTSNAAATTSSGQTQPKVKAQVNLFPPKGAPARKALGVVQVVDVSGQQAINAVVQGLPPTTKAGYGIWLYRNPSNEKWLGYFQSADQQGRAIAQGALPDDISQYREMLVTRESRRDPPHPGTIFLRGTIGPPPAPSTNGTGTGTGTGG
jgi:hypothetical protein